MGLFYMYSYGIRNNHRCIYYKGWTKTTATRLRTSRNTIYQATFNTKTKSGSLPVKRDQNERISLKT